MGGWFPSDQSAPRKEKQKEETEMKRRSTRNKNGTFRNHPGKENTTWHATLVKIGKEFKKQKGRKAKPGDIVRKRNKDGSYNKGSPWHIMTKHGWRKSPTGRKKPSPSQIKNTLERSRPGRGK